jgi:5-methylcytosine-specific restriction endonuclease McrA
MQAGKSSGNRTKRIGNRHHTTHPVAGTARAEAIDIRLGVFRQPAMQTPVLVLNASYEPINICGARRALVLVLKGVARTEEEQGAVLHSHRMNLQMPSVIRLLEYRRIPHQTRALSRKNILLRDRNTCQYCQKVLIASDLTLDHVVPRCRGGLSTWENLVACCRDCNRRKGSLMLHELTEMKLLREPRPFSLHTRTTVRTWTSFERAPLWAAKWSVPSALV